MKTSNRVLASAAAAMIGTLCGCTMLGGRDAPPVSAEALASGPAVLGSHQSGSSMVYLRHQDSYGAVAFLSRSGERSTTWIELAPRGD